MNTGEGLTAGAAKGGIVLGIAGLFAGLVLPAVIVGGASFAINDTVEKSGGGAPSP